MNLTQLYNNSVSPLKGLRGTRAEAVFYPGFGP